MLLVVLIFAVVDTVTCNVGVDHVVVCVVDIAGVGVGVVGIWW